MTTYATMTRSLQGMVERLLDLRVTRVVMAATSDYWPPPFYLLEAHGFEVWLVNAKERRAPAWLRPSRRRERPSGTSPRRPV